MIMWKGSKEFRRQLKGPVLFFLSARDIPCSWGCWRKSSNGHDGTVYAETRYEVLGFAFNFLLFVFYCELVFHSIFQSPDLSSFVK